MLVEGAMILTKSECMELQRQAGARNGRADQARHARLILLLSDGLTWRRFAPSSIAVIATLLAGASALPAIDWRGCSPGMQGASATL